MVVQRFGFPILFWSRTQSTVALSSGEAELAAMVAGVVDAKFVQSLLQELSKEVRLVLYSDSTAAIGHTMTHAEAGPRSYEALASKRFLAAAK